MRLIYLKKGSIGELLALLTILAVLLSLLRVVIFESTYLLFLLWNGFLAWLPLLFAVWLVRLCKLSAPVYGQLFIAVLWLLLLPNSFYVITDFIHVTPGDNFEALYDILLIFIYSLLGVVLGIISLKLVQGLAYKNNKKLALCLPFIVMPLIGFAIYVGRYWRWNSWDIIIRPQELIRDFSSILTDDLYRAISTSLLFAAIYLALYYIFIRYSSK